MIIGPISSYYYLLLGGFSFNIYIFCHRQVLCNHQQQQPTQLNSIVNKKFVFLLKLHIAIVFHAKSFALVTGVSFVLLWNSVLVSLFSTFFEWKVLLSKRKEFWWNAHFWSVFFFYENQKIFTFILHICNTQFLCSAETVLFWMSCSFCGIYEKFPHFAIIVLRLVLLLSGVVILNYWYTNPTFASGSLDWSRPFSLPLTCTQNAKHNNDSARENKVRSWIFVSPLCFSITIAPEWKACNEICNIFFSHNIQSLVWMVDLVPWNLVDLIFLFILIIVELLIEWFCIANRCFFSLYPFIHSSRFNSASVLRAQMLFRTKVWFVLDSLENRRLNLLFWLAISNGFCWVKYLIKWD